MLKDAVVKREGAPQGESPSSKNVNVAGGKSTDKKEESARAPNRGNKPSANVKREKSMTYEECVKTVGNTLKERGHKEHKKLATGMCDLWASENNVERKFGRAHLSTSSDEPKRRTFGVPIETSEDMTFIRR